MNEHSDRDKSEVPDLLTALKKSFDDIRADRNKTERPASGSISLTDVRRLPHKQPCGDCGRTHLNGEHVAMSTPSGRIVWEGCMDCWAVRTSPEVSRRLDAEAKLARVEALADEWNDASDRERELADRFAGYHAGARSARLKAETDLRTALTDPS